MITTVDRKYEMKPEYGNISFAESNKTHNGRVIFGIKQKITSFEVRIFYV